MDYFVSFCPFEEQTHNSGMYAQELILLFVLISVVKPWLTMATYVANHQNQPAALRHYCPGHMIVTQSQDHLVSSLNSSLSKNGTWTYGSTGNEWTKWCETIVNLEFFSCEGISGVTVGS